MDCLTSRRLDPIDQALITAGDHVEPSHLWKSHPTPEEPDSTPLFFTTNEYGWKETLAKIKTLPEIDGSVVLGVGGIKLLDIFGSRPDSVSRLIVFDPNTDLCRFWKEIVLPAIRNHPVGTDAIPRIDQETRAMFLPKTHNVLSFQFASLLGQMHLKESAFRDPVKWKKVRAATLDDRIQFIPTNLNFENAVEHLGNTLGRLALRIDLFYISNIADPKFWMEEGICYMRVNRIIKLSGSDLVHLVTAQPKIPCSDCCGILHVAVVTNTLFNPGMIPIFVHKQSQDHAQTILLVINKLLKDLLWRYTYNPIKRPVQLRSRALQLTFILTWKKSFERITGLKPTAIELYILERTLDAITTTHILCDEKGIPLDPAVSSLILSTELVREFAGPKGRYDLLPEPKESFTVFFVDELIDHLRNYIFRTLGPTTALSPSNPLVEVLESSLVPQSV